MWQSLLTVTLRDVLYKLQSSSLHGGHCSHPGSTHHTAPVSSPGSKVQLWTFHPWQPFLCTIFTLSLTPPTGYRATTRKQAHRASNAFSVKTVTQGWHQGWQRKTHCFCHLRNLHLRSQKELVQLFGLWTLRVTSSARTQRWLEAQFHAIPTPFNSPRDHGLPLSTPAPREQHAMQSTPSNIRSHQKSHFHDINIALANTFPNRILTHAASHRKHT